MVLVNVDEDVSVGDVASTAVPLDVDAEVAIV